MKILISIFILLINLPNYGKAQPFQLQGTVVDEKDGKPLAGASVFINNGSRGTVTDQDGRFILKEIPSNSFELVVSFVSYGTMVVDITPANIGKRFRIQMSFKQTELEDVIVEPIEKDGWKTWGKTFVDHFLGVSANAQKCVLLNPETLIFRHNKKTGLLKVSARDQLKIRNNALGYNINYQLEQFEYDPKNTMVVYLGYIHFEEIKANNKRRRDNWIRERKEAYQGSVMHFMRSFYENKLSENGFNIRQMIRLIKKDTATRRYYDRIIKSDFRDVDTSKFFIQFVKPGTFSDIAIHILGKQLLSADSIRFRDSINTQTLMYFHNIIEVTFLNEKEPAEYLRLYRRTGNPGMQSSLFYFRGNRPIAVQQNGLYYEPLDIFAEGYWSFEKLAELLPTDYVEK